MTTKAKKDYSEGKIYKIEPTVAHDEGDIYIGSTTNKYLSQRMTKHRCGYNRWKLELSKAFMTSFTLFETYGFENCKIILIENVNASNYDELVSREAHFIKILKCVNRVVPLRTIAEYNEDNREKIQEYKKQHYEINKLSILQKHKEYREEHKEQLNMSKRDYYKEHKQDIRERNKQYYNQHIEEAREYNKEYYQSNKERLQFQYQKYYESNKSEKIEYQKNYAERNKEKIREYKKDYYLKQKRKKDEGK